VDVVFVGTWEAERCKQLEALVVAIPARYSIWGTQWEKVNSSSPLHPFLHHKPALMDDMAKAVHGAKVSLAFLRKENRDDYTQRSFEIPACGGVLLGERTKRHQGFYREGKDAEFFDADSINELVAKVSLLLSDHDHREMIRRSGRSALLQQKHTYEDRLNRLIEIYSSERRNVEHRVSNSLTCHFV
jgi:spore maturation protein CgeB